MESKEHFVRKPSKSPENLINKLLAEYEAFKKINKTYSGNDTQWGRLDSTKALVERCLRFGIPEMKFLALIELLKDLIVNKDIDGAADFNDRLIELIVEGNLMTKEQLTKFRPPKNWPSGLQAELNQALYKIHTLLLANGCSTPIPSKFFKVATEFVSKSIEPKSDATLEQDDKSNTKQTP